MLKLLCFVFLAALASGSGSKRMLLNTTDMLTVSGISAGGFMAAQLHVAYSSQVKGAAIFAGGPYYCSRGQISIALTECTSFPLLLDVNELVSLAKGFASNDQIDPLSNLQNSPVYLFSGTADTVVKQTVVKKNGEFYTAFGANVKTEFTIDAEHCQPTLSFGNDCTMLGSPFISHCQYDGAGEGLKVLYGKALRPRGTTITQNIKKISQARYFPNGESVIGMSDTAYVYVPTACQNGAKCSIHVAFHGCNQELDAIGTVFVRNAGYLPWAESNNIIVLFPQAAKADFHENPDACFEWWQISDPNFAFKNGKQLTTVMNTVAAIKSARGPEFLE